jgi:uncharacterized repeat protein (TIGR03803 family)
VKSEKSAQWSWLSEFGSTRNGQAVRNAGHRRSQRLTQAVGSALRPHLEAMENRVLLSASPLIAINTLGYFGANANGGLPRSALTADSKGNLYGTTSEGGTYGAGTVFEIPAGSNKLTTLYSFNGVHGRYPYAGVTLDPKGDIFGTTFEGGTTVIDGKTTPTDFGTVYEIAAGPVPILTTLASFIGHSDAHPSGGEHPIGGVTLDSLGNLYGTTDDGGDNSIGTVWKIALNSNTITTLASFGGTVDAGSRPNGSLILDSAGNLYGTTQFGGGKVDNGTITPTNFGTIFKIAVDTSTITTLASFNGDNGNRPEGALAMDSAGDLYGTTEFGGANGAPAGFGTVFEVTASTPGVITTVASFDGTHGANPYAPVTIDTAGNLYGTTLAGGLFGKGTVFKIPTGSHSLTTLVSFDANGDNGATPYGGIFVDSSGNLLGTTELGGGNGAGTVFEIPTGTNILTTVISFDGVGTTLYPYTEGVTLDPSGDVFGMTPNGGALNQGSVYEIAAGTTTFTTLASFDGINNGSIPEGFLAIDAKGNLFGATNAGGTNNDGTLFEIANGSNTITTLYTFAGTDGANPSAGVTIDSAGNLFGTTTNGGSTNSGEVFELTKGAQSITVLASFDPTKNGENPTSVVTLDASGNIFGAASGIDNSASPNGVNSTGGIIYEIASGSNAITTIASMSYDKGQYLSGEFPNGVILDSAGNLYGTASSGGANGTGTVFEIGAGSHNVTTLLSFAADDVGTDVGNVGGANPFGNLVIDSSGNLFGNTYQGGAFDDGTVFEIPQDSRSTLSTLATFSGRDGAFPFVGMAIDKSGNLFGTTEEGGVINSGTVFEVSTQSVVTIAPDGAPNPATASEPLGYTVTVADQVPDGETVTIIDTSNGGTVVASGTLNSDTAVLTIPGGTLAKGTHNLVAVYGGDATFPPGQSLPYAQIIDSSAAPNLVGNPVINGDNPNGLFNAPGQGSTFGRQRSMVEDIVYTFDEAVSIPDANKAFTIVATGAHPGTVPSTLIATAVAGSAGTQWAVTLSGKAAGVLGSIANGEYSITINPDSVFSADGTTPLTAGRTDTFYRLFGDINGDKVVNVADEFQFSKALNVYNPAFDYNGDGTVNLADEFQASKSFSSGGYVGDGFVTTI